MVYGNLTGRASSEHFRVSSVLAFGYEEEDEFFLQKPSTWSGTEATRCIAEEDDGY